MIDFAPAFVQPPEMPGNKFHALYAHPLPHLPRAVRFPDCSLQMLYTCCHIRRLDSTNYRNGKFTGQSWIFTDIFKISSACRCSLILIPGARITSLPLPRASSPNTFLHCVQVCGSMSSQSHCCSDNMSHNHLVFRPASTDH